MVGRFVEQQGIAGRKQQTRQTDAGAFTTGKDAEGFEGIVTGEHHGAERGAHARSAFGVAQIPMGACVEIELIAELA